MRIPSGTTDRYIYFVAVDSTDLKTRETGLSSFTVYYEIENGTATAMTTPTVTESDATNMPGVYTLLIDESAMTTLTAGHDTAELCLHITQASMAPVTRVIEIFRAKITEGQTITAANGCADADVERLLGVVQSATDLKDFADDGYDPSTNKVQGVVLADTVTAVTGLTAADVGAIKAKTDNLPSDPADHSVVIAATDAILAAVGDVPTNAELATALAGADDATLAAVAAVKSDTAAILDDTGTGGVALSAGAVDAILDEVVETSSGRTMRQLLRGFTAALLGKASGLGTTEVIFRDTDDGTNVIVATVDANGNRTDVTLDLS